MLSMSARNLKARSVTKYLLDTLGQPWLAMARISRLIQNLAPVSRVRLAVVLSLLQHKLILIVFAEFGRANEALARRQEAYVGSATGAWLESLERSLAQLKEYQVRSL